jgi:hypothetical protein
VTARGRGGRARPLVGALLACAGLAACGEDPPVRPGPCAAAAAPIELARLPDGLWSLRAAGDGVVFGELRGRDYPGPANVIRRLNRDGSGLDLVTLPGDDRQATLLATADEVFWGAVERGLIIRRLDVKSVPLAGGPVRTLGMAGLDWSDASGLRLAVEPFAADARAVYFSAERLGSSLIEVEIHAMARADGALDLRARTMLDAHDAQLVDGQIWWRDGHDLRRLHRVPAAGPATVVDVTLSDDCRDLLVTAGAGLFCGGSGTLTRYRPDGGDPRLILHAPNDTGGGSDLRPLAVQGEWLWLHEIAGWDGHVRKLHLGAGMLEDVVCSRVKVPPVLTDSDVVWSEPTTSMALDPAAALMRQPR